MNNNIRKLVRHGNIAEAAPLILTTIDNGTLDNKSVAYLLAHLTDADLLQRVKLYAYVKEKLGILSDFATIVKNSDGYTAMFKILKKCNCWKKVENINDCFF